MNTTRELAEQRDAGRFLARELADSGRGIGPLRVPAALAADLVDAILDGVEAESGIRPPVIREP